MKLLQRLWKEESGQGLVEYGLLVALIVGVVIAALLIFGNSLSDFFTGIGDSLQGQLP